MENTEIMNSRPTQHKPCLTIAKTHKNSLFSNLKMWSLSRYRVTPDKDVISEASKADVKTVKYTGRILGVMVGPTFM